MIASFVRGLSVRDVQATLVQALGEDATVSKSAVSGVCAELKTQFETWSRRDLSGLTLDYLFLDASFFKYHANAGAEPVLAAWGSTPTASRCSSGSTPRRPSRTDAWSGFLSDLGERGLGSALLVISDGAAGLISAAELTMPGALRQRCLIHRARNIVAKVSKNALAEVKADYWAIFDVPEEIEPGLDAVAFANKRIDQVALRWRDSYPVAVRCLLSDRESLTVYLQMPREHWPRIRHSNLIERTFGQTRRRVKVIGRLPGEHSVTSLVWAVLDRAWTGWRGFTMTAAGLRLLHDLRRALLEPPTELHPHGGPEPAKQQTPDQAGQQVARGA